MTAQAPGIDLPEDVEALVASVRDVVDDAGLAAACAACRTAGWVAVDTEFERTDTFFPRIALLQLYAGERVFLVDPLRVGDPAPVRELLEDPAVEKVLHACSEDVEVLAHWSGARPVALFDTQLAAAFLGARFGIGYGELVRTELGIDLGKGETRSDWLARPLSAAQRRYAALDVIYLAAVYRRQAVALEALGRRPWAVEEVEALVREVAERSSVDDAWRNVRGAGALAPRALAALQGLAAWRERAVREVDRPRNRVARDEHLVRIAEALPEDVSQLAGANVPHGLVRRWRGPLQAAVDAARALPAAELPAPLAPPLTREEGEWLKALRRRARERAREFGLADELLARKRLVEQLLLEPDAVPAAYRGWRWAPAGRELVALRDRLVGAGTAGGSSSGAAETSA